MPKGAEQLLAANDRMREGTPEALPAALNACRRFRVTVAYALFPAPTRPFVDFDGNERKVGADEYKKRLVGHIQTAKVGSTQRDVLVVQLKQVADRLDALQRNSSKGVHADVPLHEAQLVFLQLYLIVAEIIATAPPPPRVETAPSPIGEEAEAQREPSAPD